MQNVHPILNTNQEFVFEESSLLGKKIEVTVIPKFYLNFNVRWPLNLKSPGFRLSLLYVQSRNTAFRISVLNIVEKYLIIVVIMKVLYKCVQKNI